MKVSLAMTRALLMTCALLVSAIIAPPIFAADPADTAAPFSARVAGLVERYTKPDPQNTIDGDGRFIPCRTAIGASAPASRASGQRRREPVVFRGLASILQRNWNTNCAGDRQAGGRRERFSAQPGALRSAQRT